MNFRKKYNSALYWMLIPMLVASCNNTIIINPEFSNRVVVDAFFASGDSIGLNLFKNLSLADSLQSSSDYFFEEGLDNAFVRLYDNDILTDTLKQGKYACEYQSDIVAKEGHEYKIIVTRDGYPEAEAVSSIPVFVPVDTIRYILSADSINMKLNIEFSDKAETENYYVVRFYTLQNGFKKNRGFYNIDPVFGSNLKFDFNILGFESGLNEVFRAEISDDGYDGERITYQALLPTRFSGVGAVNDIFPSDTIGIMLYSVNKELYDYNRSIEIYEQAQNSGAQPTDIYTNVKNGVGLFTGYSLTKYEFQFD